MVGCIEEGIAAYIAVTVRADCQGTMYEVTVYDWQTMSCEDLYRRWGGIYTCRLGVRSVLMHTRTQAITTRQVSAVTYAVMR